MRRILLVALVLTGFLIGLPIGTESPRPAQAAAEGWAIDPVHSFVLFRIKHLDLGYVHGRFNEFSGAIQLDEAAPETSSVRVEVKAASVDTGVKKRDDHLRSPDFFDAVQFATISFRSTKVKKADGAGFEVTGDLTLHGVTKPVTVRMEKVGSGKDPGGRLRVGFEGTFEIRRSDYAMTGLLEAAGDAVRVTLAFEAVKS